MSFTHALKWSFLSELAVKAIQPMVFIVLARLLTPEDFGVMTAAMMVIAFSQIFWEAGMGKALIQRQTQIEEAANAAFMINIGLGVVIACLLYLFAQPIAQIFFQDDRVTAVLQVMTLQVLLGALGSVHTALLQKEMGFKKLFWVRVSTVALPGLASIPLALNDWGYWALVTGTLVGQLAQVMMLWWLSHWRPGLTRDIYVTKDLARFALWVGSTGFMVWFYTWVDALIVGMYLGAHELGLFRIGNQFSTMIFGTLLGSIAPVLYSHFVQFDQNKLRMRIASIKVMKTLTLISIPIGIMLFQLSAPIGSAILGDKWHGVGLVIGLMALVHGYAWVVGMSGEIYRAMNKPSYESIMAGSTMFIYIAAYFYSIQYGLDVFLWTRLGLCLLGLVVHLMFLRKLLEIHVMPILYYITTVTTVSGVIVFMIDQLILVNTSNDWLRILIGGTLSSLFIAVVIYYSERNGVLKDVLALLGKRAGSVA